MLSEFCMQRVPFVCGNWKMHKTVSESLALVKELRSRVDGSTTCEIGIAPPFTSLSAVKAALETSPIKLVAQNVHEEPKGAFTGEVSVPMLVDLGCDYVLLGHSERRHLFGETDARIAKKVQAALEGGLKVILALGETLEEREDHRTLDVVSKQLSLGLVGLSADQLNHVVLAYEPVWAIGTGRTASPEQAQEVHQVLRTEAKKLWGESAAASLRIQYGGSVKPGNARELFQQSDVDGGLIGGASLKAEDFEAICKASVA